MPVIQQLLFWHLPDGAAPRCHYRRPLFPELNQLATPRYRNFQSGEPLPSHIETQNTVRGAGRAKISLLHQAPAHTAHRQGKTGRAP